MGCMQWTLKTEGVHPNHSLLLGLSVQGLSGNPKGSKLMRVKVWLSLRSGPRMHLMKDSSERIFSVCRDQPYALHPTLDTRKACTTLSTLYLGPFDIVVY